MTPLYKALESLPEDVADNIGDEISGILVPHPQDFPFTIVIKQEVFARLLRKIAEGAEDISPEDVETILAQGDKLIAIEF